MNQDIAIVMRYTGWSYQISASAIEQWRHTDPYWNAQYILRYQHMVAAKYPISLLAEREGVE